MKFTILFFTLLIVFTGVSFSEPTEMGVKFCNIGADPVNSKLEVLEGQEVGILPAGTIVAMTTGSGKKVTCTLKSEEAVVYKYGIPRWILRCGNPLITVSLPQIKLSNLTKRFFMKDDYRPARIMQVSECGPGTECWARSKQFKASVGLNFGANAIWHFGLPDYNVSYNQNQNAQGGAGGQGGDGYGGQGGSGGNAQGGNGTGGSAGAVATNVNTNDPGGPTNPDDPPGGGPVDPDDPPGGGPVDPNDPIGGGPVNP